MYSRNTKNNTDSYEYPFTLPERYGGSRFRPAREPTTRIHTETSMPQTPSPIHHSPAANFYITPEKNEEAKPTPPPPAITDTFEEVAMDADGEQEDILHTEDATKTNTENAESPSETHEAATSTVSPASSLLAGLTGEDLLLIGLILLLSREGEDSSELSALLALLLAYRGSPSENK